ncbi:hypothetical protein PV325_001771 [Microctonus aethiopoides]|nr:hypothetical protein PV325_001771 [Microctonus aethiopoides]
MNSGERILWTNVDILTNTADVWTNIISFAFWEQYRIPCAFVFKCGKIVENGLNYAIINVRCKDRSCSNSVRGVIKDAPLDEEPVVITMKCRDTCFQKHADVKRMITPEKARENLEELVARWSFNLTVINTPEIDADKTIIFEDLPSQATHDKKLNTHYVPGLYPDLVDKMKDFALWTNVCTPKTILHIADILGGVNIFRSKIKKFVTDNCLDENQKKPKEDNWYENWKGLGKSETATDYYWASDYVNVSNKVEQKDSVSMSENHINFTSNTYLAESKSDQNDSLIITIQTVLRKTLQKLSRSSLDCSTILLKLLINRSETNGYLCVMEKKENNLNKGSSSTDAKLKGRAEIKKIEMRNRVEVLKHAHLCQDKNCLPKCWGMRKYIYHERGCNYGLRGRCAFCEYLFTVSYYHAIECQDKVCTVPHCLKIRGKLKYIQLRSPQAKLLGKMAKMSIKSTAQKSRIPNQLSPTSLPTIVSDMKCINIQSSAQPSTESKDFNTDNVATISPQMKPQAQVEAMEM